MSFKNIFPLLHEFLPCFSSYLSNLTSLLNLMLNIVKFLVPRAILNFILHNFVEKIEKFQK